MEVLWKAAERLLDADNDDTDGSSNPAGITEESIAEFMRWLELEIKLAAAPGYATTPCGCHESCGPAALSGPASTVMAGVVGPPTVLPWAWPAPGTDAAAAAKEHQEEELSDGEWASFYFIHTEWASPIVQSQIMNFNSASVNCGPCGLTVSVRRWIILTLKSSTILFCLKIRPRNIRRKNLP
jgi:hypothetical protein